MNCHWHAHCFDGTSHTSRPFLIATCSAWKCAGSWPPDRPGTACCEVFGRAPHGDTAPPERNELDDWPSPPPNKLVEEAGAPKRSADDAGAPNSPPVAAPPPLNKEEDDAPNSEVPPDAGLPKRPPDAAGAPKRPPPVEAAGVPNSPPDDAAGVPNKPPPADEAGVAKRPPDAAGVPNRLVDAAFPPNMPPGCDVPASRGDWPAAGRLPSCFRKMSDVYSTSSSMTHMLIRTRSSANRTLGQRSLPAADAPPNSELPELGAPKRLVED